MTIKIESDSGITIITETSNAPDHFKLLEDIMNFIKKRITEEIDNDCLFFRHYDRQEEAVISLCSTLTANIIILFCNQEIPNDQLLLGSLSLLQPILECSISGLKARFDAQNLINKEIH